MKKFLCAFFALMLIFSAAAFAESANNLVRNGDFSEIDAAGMPVHWEKDMWFTDAGVSKFYVAEDGYDGNCAAIINFSDNDARFRQTISVEPDSYYRLSCFARAADCGAEGYGATLSIEDTFTYSNKAAAMLAEDEMDEDEDEIAQSFLIKDVDDPDFGEELGYGDDYDNYDNN
jgi:hypothetical protein